MSDSEDIFGEDPSEDTEAEKPSAAELEAEGQSALFGGADTVPDNSAELVNAGDGAGDEAGAGDGAAPDAASDASGSESSVPETSTSPPPEKAAQPYRVLARKYRPQTFSELIGQEPMVRTLANAIERDRLAHAFLMTGVRGVGKTSTARLISKALNCVGPDGEGGPTIDPCGQCEPCVAIAEGRHIDVIEMDAASHTGVDDVREIIEAVRYAAVSARYKIYIIDEVHMLSRNAFNALLKTLEEPPAHVKFLFATTEVDKLPVTVLSRCQRFDLRRIPKDLLIQQFASICGKEGVEAEDEALSIIASASEGSSRDGLSILDQAIAHADLDGDQAGGGTITAERVRDMLGLADKGAQRQLFSALLEGDAVTMLDAVDHQYALGVEPLALLRSLMEITHRVAVSQVGNSGSDAPTQEERQAVDEWAERLTTGQVHRLWQLLVKGHDEVRSAPDPLVAAQMALLRVLHAADMPDPGKLAKQLEDLAASGGAGAAVSGSPGVSSQGGPGSPGSSESSAPSTAIAWPELCDRVEANGMLRTAGTMRDWVRVIECVRGSLTYSLAPGLAEDPASDLREALLKVTGERWQVELGEGEALLSLRELAEAAKAAEDAQIRQSPMVEAALAAFPDAEFVDDDNEGAGGDRNWSKRA